MKKIEEGALPILALETFDHPFPYRYSNKIIEQDILKVSKMCPNIKNLNLVSLDLALPFYYNFQYLTRANIEIEDAFGMGLYNFLQVSGPKLRELTISCGLADWTWNYIENGGSAFQSFNIGLKLAQKFCPELRILNISGRGLVTKDLLDHFDRHRNFFEIQNNDSKLTKLKMLTLLTYYESEEMAAIQTCEEGLLLKVLSGN